MKITMYMKDVDILSKCKFWLRKLEQDLKFFTPKFLGVAVSDGEKNNYRTKIFKMSFKNKNLVSKALLWKSSWYTTPFSISWKPIIKILKQCQAHRTAQVYISAFPASIWSKEMLSPWNPRPIIWQRKGTLSYRSSILPYILYSVARAGLL